MHSAVYAYRIYFIRHRSVYSFQMAGGGRRLLEGSVYSHNNKYVAKQFVCSTVSLCLLLQLSRCSQAFICLLSRRKGHCRPHLV